MAKKKKDEEGYYAVSAGIAVILSLLVHWLLLSGLEIHSTLHAAIGIGAFFVFTGILSPIIKKFW